MAALTRIWMATLTRDLDSAGTNDPINISINDGGASDKLNESFDRRANATGYLRRSEASLFTRNVSNATLDSNDSLPSNAIRLSIGGQDLWLPETVFVWASDDVDFVPPTGELIEPLALAFETDARLSAELGEGVGSMPIPKVTGNNTIRPVVIERLLLIVETKVKIKPSGNTLPDIRHFEPGTDDDLRVRVVNPSGERLTDVTIGNTPQTDLEPGRANMYFLPVQRSFTIGELASDSISVEISGNDYWSPNRFFLFGLDTHAGQPSSVVPIAHVSNWMLPMLSQDSNDLGTAQTVTVPTLPLPPSTGIATGSGPATGGAFL